ncbi:hypothetical protein N2152v2_001930 [Parachlorella kessleri]
MLWFRSLSLVVLSAAALQSHVAPVHAIITTDQYFSYTNLFPKFSGVLCPELSLASLTSQPDVVPSLTKLNDFFDPSGILFLGSGTYRVKQNLKLTKTIYAEAGAVFEVASGVTLTISAAVSHPDTTFFTGPGTVQWGPAGPEFNLNPVVPVDWFGAKGDGVTDDAAAIQRAFDSAPSTVRFAAKVYRITRAVTVKAGVFSDKGAVLQGLGSSVTGLLFPNGASGQLQLPTLKGFGRALQTSGGLTASIPSISSSGVGIYVLHPGTSGGFGIRVDVSSMAKVGRAVVFKSAAAPVNWNLYLQGSAIRVGLFDDMSTKVAKALVHFEGPYRIGWDSNHFEFGEVRASVASGFALLRCDPSVCSSDSNPLPKINLFVTKALQPLSADSKLLDGYMTDCELRLRLTAPLTPAQTATQNVFSNSFIFYDPSAIGSRVYKPVTTPDITLFKQQNFGQPVHATRFNLQLPQQAWKQGDRKMFYLYHQLAQNKKLYYITEARYGGMCNSVTGVAVTSMIDNSGTAWKPGSRDYEVMIEVMACRSIAATDVVKLVILAGSPGWP